MRRGINTMINKEQLYKEKQEAFNLEEVKKKFEECLAVVKGNIKDEHLIEEYRKNFEWLLNFTSDTNVDLRVFAIVSLESFIADMMKKGGE